MDRRAYLPQHRNEKIAREYSVYQGLRVVIGIAVVLFFVGNLVMLGIEHYHHGFIVAHQELGIPLLIYVVTVTPAAYISAPLSKRIKADLMQGEAIGKEDLKALFDPDIFKFYYKELSPLATTVLHGMSPQEMAEIDAATFKRMLAFSKHPRYAEVFTPAIVARLKEVQTNLTIFKKE